MFGIGPMEMGIIGVVALLIFGPEKLPEMMGQAGKLVRDFRNMTSEMSGEFEKTVAEAKGIGKQINSEMGSMTKQVSSVTNSVQKELGGTKKTGAKGSKSTTAGKKSTSSSKKSGATSASRRPAAAKSSSTAASSSSSSTTTSSRPSSSASKSDKASTSTTASKPKAAPVVQASREDPSASISLFEPDAPKRQHRARKATLSAFGESTPRDTGATREDVPAEAAGPAPKAAPNLDDPLVRARQRRQAAGYARGS